MHLPALPILAVLPALGEALATGPAVLTAPPGSGKTTLVPLALLDAPWLAGRSILMLEPRRLAARAAAARMASLLGEEPGQTVGYQIRFDRRISPETRIEVLTEGILTRRLQGDAGLDGVGLVIFDEFHERSLHADLALALCLDLCQLRDDLRLLIMSATLDTGPLAQLLGGAPVIVGGGLSHAVRTDYLPRPGKGRISEQTAAGVRRAAAEEGGDILVFLPGTGDIAETLRLLSQNPAFADFLLHPLSGDLSREAQDRAILPDPQGRRRVILATSIAETSLTIEGVGCVVDSGWSRLPGFDPASGLSRLTTVRVSKAAASQRAGRAGRLGPGRCLRLWTREEHHSLPAFHPPEMTSVDLAGLALELALWGVDDPRQLAWLDPPRPGPFAQARDLLHALGAITASGRITGIGRQLATLPTHPRLGHMLITAAAAGQGFLACDLAAIVSERDPFSRDGDTISAELGRRHRLLEQWRQGGDAAVRREGGDPIRCRHIDQTARAFRQLIDTRGDRPDPDLIGDLLVHAYPDRIARRRPGSSERYQLATGRSALLSPADPLTASEWLVAPLVDGGQAEGRIFLAEPLDPGLLRQRHPCLYAETKEVFWEDASARVIVRRRLALGGIIVEEGPLPAAGSGAISAAMLDGVRRLGIDCLPWQRETRQFQARVEWLRHLQPKAGWPDLSDAGLMADLGWLEPFVAGMTRADQFRQLDLRRILGSLLGWERQQHLDRDAPPTVTVPSGSAIRIDYSPDGPPVLAVRLQELFGLNQTPAICGGTVPLLLHLLSPARRPIQVTADLAGFWQRGYVEVKKELKGRYPKHAWPEDPARAEATRGVKRPARPGQG